MKPSEKKREAKKQGIKNVKKRMAKLEKIKRGFKWISRLCFFVMYG